MDGMKTNSTNLVRMIFGLTLALMLSAGAANAQPAPAANDNSGKAAETKKAQKTADAKKAKKPEMTPTYDSVGEDAGDFTVTSTFEVGYRGIRVGGDVNKYKSDLNYKAGPRLFDSSFLVKSKDGGKGQAFDSLLVTSTGWGADPTGTVRFSMEKPEWYRFEGNYRRFKYYRFLNNLANPNWLFTPIPVPPNPVTGLHGINAYSQLG